MSSRRLGALALATALSTAALAVPTATAATDGSAAVISEVYGGAVAIRALPSPMTSSSSITPPMPRLT